MSIQHIFARGLATLGLLWALAACATGPQLV